ncbi:Cytochrome c6 [Paraburkholderia aspalathi]|uniref:c-type cytochrome n=1 Tax=Paraburkholderia aspalathi TaxID=1324617 RepID=UPI00190DB184|nr:c-type cytochrome [Paraburkholderia aspalathi]MBK3841556.1 c-type cytochrome [Paraburkholderia aspalathi]CAE6807788.1 Cytochrome c6 [Paraburkholderia aspalathi]
MKAHFPGCTVRIAMVAAAAVACAWPILSQADSDTDIEAGRALFMQKGCFECHGIFGQGSIATGPALAPRVIPLPAMEAYVRDPQGQMPVFSEKILSNDEIAKIHAYLASLPPSQPADSIALLNNGTSPASAPGNSSSTSRIANPAAHGASVYAANCAACHGQAGEGGAGPALIGISSRYRTADIEARIREPSGIMPRLYPGPLNAQDLQDVVRYVASLK